MRTWQLAVIWPDNPASDIPAKDWLDRDGALTVNSRFVRLQRLAAQRLRAKWAARRPCHHGCSSRQHVPHDETHLAAAWASAPMVLVSSGMRSRIDRAGRLVIPKALRDQLGLRPGEVELTADDAALRMVPVHEDTLAEADGRLVIPASGISIDNELVQALRDADRRS